MEILVNITQYPESDKSAEAIYWMAKSFMNMNDTINTIKSFNDIITKYPKSDYAPLSMLEQGTPAEKEKRLR